MVELSRIAAGIEDADIIFQEFVSSSDVNYVDD